MPIAENLYERIVAAKVFIDENFHEAINLDDISQKAFLSRFHFHRLFWMDRIRRFHRTHLSDTVQRSLFRIWTRIPSVV